MRDERDAVVAEQPIDSSGHPAPSRGHVALPALWFGLFGGPAAWSVQTLVNLSLASHGCYPRLEPLATSVVGGLRGIAFVVSLVVLGACIAALATAWRAWRRTREEHQGRTGHAGRKGNAQALLETGEGRTRFMALAGVLTSVTFVVASAVHTAAVFMVNPCWG
jgi:hypothetical protein